MTKTVAIHQPEYFPWLGFLDKAMRADVLVILDHVQFDRSSLQHRAKVIGPNGVFWLTIPFVHAFPQRIDEVRFADPRWATKHWKSLQQSYARAPGWKPAAPLLEAFFAAPHARLADAALASSLLLLEAFGARPPEIVRSSTLGAVGEKADLVRDICRRLGATTYLSGRTGATYLDDADFGASGIRVEVQRFTTPSYPRRAVSEDDARGLSGLDAWLNLGEEAGALLKQGGSAR